VDDVASATRNYSEAERQRRREAMQEINRKRASGEIVPKRERYLAFALDLGLDRALAESIADTMADGVEVDPEPPRGPHGRSNPERRSWLARQREHKEMESWSKQELIEHVEDLAALLCEDWRGDGEPVVGVPHIDEPVNPAKLMDDEPIPPSQRRPITAQTPASVPEPEPDRMADPDEGPFGIDWNEWVDESEALAKDHEGIAVPMAEPVSELEPPHVRSFRSHLTPDDSNPHQRVDKYVG
jgi:hypothetical protein